MARGVDDLSIEEIRKQYLDNAEPVSARILTRLQRDPRQGARRLYTILKKRYERERDERLRLESRCRLPVTAVDTAGERGRQGCCENDVAGAHDRRL